LHILGIHGIGTKGFIGVGKEVGNVRAPRQGAIIEIS